MNRTVDFQFAFQIETGETLRAMGYVTGAGAFRLSDVWDTTPSGLLHYGFEYRHGQFAPRRAWMSVYDTCPVWLSDYVNGSEFRKVANAEMRKIAKRFAKAAARQPDSEGGAE